MFQQIFNWRTGLAAVAILIVAGTIFYTQYLARKIANEERLKVELWVEASTSLLDPEDTVNTALAFKIVQANSDIPIIVTNENDSILEHRNLDTLKLQESGYLEKMLRKLKATNEPIIWKDPFNPEGHNRYYFGHTRLLTEIKYFPIVQLFIVGLFIIVTILALRSSYRSVQNQVWAGMAKETAHQLGTPVSSLEGWAEMMKDKPGNEKIIQELEKDINRLKLVSDRFGKIGSTPQLEEMDLIKQITEMVEYIRKRASDKVLFSIHTHGKENLIAKVSAPLFDWVIENLLKNSLDAIEGNGKISIDISEELKFIQIDISDTGKGISRQYFSKVFKPGFTTKKRGWGLGLSLSKRIIEQYHRGRIFVKSSETGAGTVFRILLKK
jgi:hypothetical protein